jgi:hypothetical protein
MGVDDVVCLLGVRKEVMFVLYCFRGFFCSIDGDIELFLERQLLREE